MTAFKDIAFGETVDIRPRIAGKGNKDQLLLTLTVEGKSEIVRGWEDGKPITEWAIRGSLTVSRGPIAHYGLSLNGWFGERDWEVV